jgi:glutaminase
VTARQLAVTSATLAIVGFSPDLDEAGNSVRGAKAIHHIVEQPGVNRFGSGK